MPQSLVIHHSHVNVDLQWGPVDPRVKHLVPVVVVSVLHQLLPEVSHHVVFLVVLKRMRLLKLSLQYACLGRHRLDKHTNRHSRRERMRIDDNVRLYSTLRERHIHLRPKNRHHALLTMS